MGGETLEFTYRVRDRQGKVYKGRLEAEDKKAVIASLLKQNYYILSLQPISRSSPDINLNLSRVSSRDIIIMTRQLSTMLAAGLPILTCLKIVAEQASNKKLIQAIRKIHDDIEGGMPLWQAADCHPDIFSPVYISMLKAGEIGGVLNIILDRLTMHLEREQEISAKIKSASIYPAFISAVAVIMIFGIIIFIMPSFLSVYASSGAALPAPTRLLLSLSNFFHHFGLHLAVITAVTALLLRSWGRTNKGRWLFDNIYLHLPIVGKTIARMNVARFARTMGTLLKSGLPVLPALEVVDEVVGNEVISRAIRQARKNISEGDSITAPLAATGVFEPMVTQMIAVGEETGVLDEMLMRMADYFDKELFYMIESLLALIEPVLILLVAVLVGAIVIATLMPIFEMVNIVG